MYEFCFKVIYIYFKSTTYLSVVGIMFIWKLFVGYFFTSVTIIF